MIIVEPVTIPQPGAFPHVAKSSIEQELVPAAFVRATDSINFPLSVANIVIVPKSMSTISCPDVAVNPTAAVVITFSETNSPVGIAVVGPTAGPVKMFRVFYGWLSVPT